MLRFLLPGAGTPEAVTRQESGPAPLQSLGTRVDRALKRTTRDSTSRSRKAVLPAETLAPHCFTSHRTGGGRPLRPLFPTSPSPPTSLWGGGGGAKGEKKKSSPPISAKQTFLCYFLSSPGFRGRVLPGGLGCGRASPGPSPSVLKAGLFRPLAERAPCHPPNFSTRRRREGERPG